MRTIGYITVQHKSLVFLCMFSNIILLYYLSKYPLSTFLYPQIAFILDFDFQM